jgi:pimeloyl-ACP methyl ester carboxylesterase
MTRYIQSAAGVRVSYTQEGSGPPLLLVHGAFSNEVTNWEFVQPVLRQHFTVYAVARRGRGSTEPTEGHTVKQEAMDVLTVIDEIPEPVFLLGHSYGAQCSLAAAAWAAGRVRKLVLYEPPSPGIMTPAIMQTLENFAANHAWDAFAFTALTSLPVGRQRIFDLRGFSQAVRENLRRCADTSGRECSVSPPPGGGHCERVPADQR